MPTRTDRLRWNETHEICSRFLLFSPRKRSILRLWRKTRLTYCNAIITGPTFGTHNRDSTSETCVQERAAPTYMFTSVRAYRLVPPRTQHTSRLPSAADRRTVP